MKYQSPCNFALFLLFSVFLLCVFAYPAHGDGGVPVTVKAIDHNGRPLSGATVSLNPGGYVDVTNDKGEAFFQLNPGEYGATITYLGVNVCFGRIQVPASPRYEVTLVCNVYDLTISVTWAEKPVVGASVLTMWDGGSATEYTNKKGIAKFIQLPSTAVNASIYIGGQLAASKTIALTQTMLVEVDLLGKVETPLEEHKLFITVASPSQIYVLSQVVLRIKVCIDTPYTPATNATVYLTASDGETITLKTNTDGMAEAPVDVWLTDVTVKIVVNQGEARGATSITLNPNPLPLITFPISIIPLLAYSILKKIYRRQFFT